MTLIDDECSFSVVVSILLIIAHSEGENVPGELQPLQLNPPGDELEEHQDLQDGDGRGGEGDHRQVEPAVSPGVKPPGDEAAREPGAESQTARQEARAPCLDLWLQDKCGRGEEKCEETQQ